MCAVFKSKSRRGYFLPCLFSLPCIALAVPTDIANLTMAHIHVGNDTTNGPVAVILVPVNGTMVRARWLVWGMTGGGHSPSVCQANYIPCAAAVASRVLSRLLCCRR